MSNFLAVATVTAALTELVQGAASLAVPGATVSTERPQSNGQGGSQGQPGVNLFLYQVAPNPAYRNTDLPTRRSDSSVLTRPVEALDLSYLLSFHGDDGELEPHRMLGSVVSALHARPVLTRAAVQAVIDAAVAGDPAHFLATSDLPQQVELVKFTPLALSLEELSKLWSVFFQTPYNLSVAYLGTVVLIEADISPQSALPVASRNLYVLPFGRAVIESLSSDESDPSVFLLGSELTIRGRGLQADEVRVRVGTVEATVPPAAVSGSRVTITLDGPPFPTDSLQSGVLGVRVVHPLLLGTPPVAHQGFESNVVPMVLRPAVTSTGVADVQGTGGEPRSADVTAGLAPEVAAGQRPELLLNEVSMASPQAYVFSAPPPTAATGAVTFAVSGVRAGQYFLRVRIDGAESMLDLDPGSPGFGPTVTIP